MPRRSRMRRNGKYRLQVVEKGRWKTIEEVSNMKDASIIYDDLKRLWNRTRVVKNGKVLHTYMYKKPRY